MFYWGSGTVVNSKNVFIQKLYVILHKQSDSLIVYGCGFLKKIILLCVIKLFIKWRVYR